MHWYSPSSNTCHFNYITYRRKKDSGFPGVFFFGGILFGTEAKKKNKFVVVLRETIMYNTEM